MTVRRVTGPTDDALVVAPSGGMPGVGPAGPAVLFIGDSMLRRAGFRCDPPRRLSTLAVPGYTLSRWVRTGSTEVRRWLGRVGEGRPDVILWLGGNDVYPRGPSYCPSTVVRTLHRLQEIIVDLQGLGCSHPTRRDAPPGQRPPQDMGADPRLLAGTRPPRPGSLDGGPVRPLGPSPLQEVWDGPESDALAERGVFRA